MSRARAYALHLVNWKGVFLERYLLDRHVTALEGANGAGKTTVMIAAYVALLPDLSRLKFVNVGETGATGGDRGIWGRLGEAGPSYTALEIELEPGERVLCGVHIERKAAPALAFTPFLVPKLPANLSAEQLWLRQSAAHEEILDLKGLAANLAERAAGLEVLGSAKEYFARLFELGIGALRLGTDEERNKFNDMLRTSMTGGISRTLTNDLRSFLFKQETALFDTLSRMRQNLDACRRTRLEVSEARQLEQEINGIHAAGHAMFEAALGAARAQSKERQRAADLARDALGQANELVLELETTEAEVGLRQSSLGPRLSRAEAAERAARERVAQLERACAAAERAKASEAARAALVAPLAEAQGRKAEANAQRDSARADRDAAQATLLRAAAGLADLQAGLEELHRQSHAFGRVRAALQRARELLAGYSEEAADAAADFRDLSLDTAGPSPAQVRAALERARSALEALDRERAERHRKQASAERNAAELARVRAALALLSGSPDAADAGIRARAELARLNELELLSGRSRELETEYRRTRALADRQAAFRAELAGLDIEPPSSAQDFALGVGKLEQQWREAEQRQREHELGAERAAERARASEAQQGELEARSERYRRLAEVAQRLRGRGEEPPQSSSELAARVRVLEEKKRRLQAEAERLERERGEALAAAQECDTSSAAPDRELVALAERVDGQLLGARYEDLDVDAARRMQAELGPLNAAIVVEDPERTLPLVCSEPLPKDGVWLVRASDWPRRAPALVPLAGGEELSGYVAVDLGYGLRIAPLPSEVQLGRAARERRARELRDQAAAKETEIEQLNAELRAIEAARAAFDQLWEHWAAWSGGDPAAELARVRDELERARALSLAEQRAAREERLACARLRSAYQAQRPLLGDHHLLDPPQYAEMAEAARCALSRAQGARAELERSREARATLLAGLHHLDAAAPDPAELAAWRAAEPRLDAQRDRLFRAIEALLVVDSEHAAWAWSDAERALSERTSLVPELTAQHRRAELEVARTQAEYARAEADWEVATSRAQRASAELAAAEAVLVRARAELGGTPGDDPSSTALALGSEELGRARELLERLRAEERGIEAELALCGERLRAARKALGLSQSGLDRELSGAEPAARAWTEIERAAQQAGLLEVARGSSEPGAMTSAQLWLEARSKRTLLADRLRAARGADELASIAAERWPEADATAAQLEDLGSRYLKLWLAVRNWLSKRLPTALGDSSDPSGGLGRLQGDLAQLERRLERQEGNLRGTSADVARSIDVQIRRAQAQVRRLNAALSGIGFGSITGIRVDMDRVAKMDQVLRALREGETQELLFQSDLPIEAAFDEIFRRHAGGRSGGQRLIDYREYLELWVSIQRRSNDAWERVNPSQVSTGEAIGVGAALMMVILAEWERDDQLLRQRRGLGSLRFLFLDEANRLSQDNLGVLFDLCRTLDLQLLIAAPEVARAEGNTTYRLVRRVNAAGREEVLVTGRRVSLPSAPEVYDTSEASAAPAPAVQVDLFGSAGAP